MKPLKILALASFTLFNIMVYGQAPNDCINAVVACGNSVINLNVNGFGNQELIGSNACGIRENHSVWFKVTPATSGTLGFTLRPNSTSIDEDYDFFVFGPNTLCDNIGQAIRCSANNPLQSSQGNNLTGMNGTSIDISEQPGNGGDSFVRWLDVQAGETYLIVIDRPIGNSGFSLEWTGSATFSPPPTNQAVTSGTPLNLQSCDVTAPFNDGITEFDLTPNRDAIRGSQTDVTITYHTSESDANIGINAIPDRYTNTSNQQIIHARITNDITDCFDITQFRLSVESGPNFTLPTPYTICDDLSDGDDRNGRNTFTLSSKNDEILNGLNPSDVTITYHNTLAGAEQNDVSTLLPDSYYNTTAFNEEIYFRIEDISNPDCASTSSLILMVNVLPQRIDHTILQCDEDGISDGLTIFNLNEANTTLTNNVDNLSTTFYSDHARTDEIIAPNNYPNISNPQPIYVEIINDDTNCVTNAELVLSVSTTNVFNNSIVKCDNDGIEDGFYTFNLNEADGGITDGLPVGLTISYYENYDNALRERNNLNNTFTNETPDFQTIYARVENNNNCYGISEVQLIVNELPDIEIETQTSYCLNFFPKPIFIDAGLNNGNITDFLYNWSTGDQDYVIQVNETGNFTVRVSNIVTNCEKERLVIVEPSNIATIESIDIDDASENNIVIVNVTGEGKYEYSLVNTEGIIYNFQESNTFENVTPGLYTVLIKDVENNCGTEQQDISVIGFPKFFTPNNDGEHDTWQVYGISDAFQSQTKILIYNRYGKLLKELSPLEEGWDGLFNGQILPTDDYWFSIKLEDGRVFKDHFTLKY
ncbi:T9SS type B sorting domain-containing protein [Hyunsoonleella ulvae]|uniref:T9SS type B sorting domain-containing protein n=1 Tax=Hyunsoonleella ulvae TaxID=2799948 RepID=UPI001EF126B9|nr:T9SS type B sorting domain-containing protein [Hyunsoonleella ulvae]